MTTELLLDDRYAYTEARADLDNRCRRRKIIRQGYREAAVLGWQRRARG